MEMANVLHMNGGLEDTSYAMNSLLQRKGISRTLPITKETVVKLMRSSSFPKGRLVMADLGCASGPNTLLLVSEVIKAVHKLSRELGQECPELQVFLNDLPGNDFNNVFTSIQGFKENMKKEMGEPNSEPPLMISIVGVPGSFYDRLFLTDSLHFIHSSYIPQGLEENKGNIYLTSSSPPGVLEAYCKQFQTDFSSFLKFRSQELVTGGRMVLTIPARRGEQHSEKECCYLLMSMALNQMATEGLIDQQKLDSFNLPLYMPSAMEVETEVRKQGSFAIEHLELWDMDWNVYEGEANLAGDGGYNLSKCMEAVFDPVIAHHFHLSREITDEVFKRYALLLSDWMAKVSPAFVSLTVSLTKRH
ncbi:unnamed protein product [Linum tenue]|uniref:Uncharacterized protein n=1 Tax=Linum tenue TaxID=586396 RepID=A0AAV0MAN8_9ROSI|nr:unnamed protein product [Linum tenue]CAI0447366.1 unnamed protein product [Linum tenue]